MLKATRGGARNLSTRVGLRLPVIGLAAGILIPACTLNSHGEAVEDLSDAATGSDASQDSATSVGGSGGSEGKGGSGAEAGVAGTSGAGAAGGMDGTGGVSGSAGAGGTAGPCTPGETLCSGGSVLTCLASGEYGAPVPCASNACAEGICSPCPAGTRDCDGNAVNGCEGIGGHCFAYTPSNVDPSSYWNWENATAATLSCDETLDTSALPAVGSGTATLCGVTLPYETRSQPNGPNIAIFWVKGLTVTSGSTIRLQGDKPVAFMVDGAVEIAGTLDAGSTSSSAGAGASASGCAAPEGTPSHGGGGGGFQFAGSGGAARDIGEASSCPATQFAGPALSCSLVPLRAGCAGGKGADGQSKDDATKFIAPGGAGGYGGGAVQISASGAVVITGAITAGGAGGGPGSLAAAENTAQLAPSCGGGGGSGGAILLEGKGVITNSKVFANGGGGGGGGPGQRDTHNGPCGKIGTAGGNGTADTTPATPGQRGEGLLDSSCADGGYTPNKWPGNGANGGTTGTPTLEAVCGEHWQGGGGGGGGGGWIVVNSY
ncbi:MAG: hypothetical protein HY898_33385 [Deltaproteobacteria bacterium]|nr:hypothetical protein [Deltaproteobacteria bacterium]